MPKYWLQIDGVIDEDEGPFDTKKDAEDAVMEWENAWHTGAETLEMSNPGDWPYNPDDSPTIEVVEVQ